MTRDENAGHITVKELIGSTGARVLITERYEEAAGAGTGQWRVAVKKRRPSWATQDQEPPGVHAATVVRVEQVEQEPGTMARYNVVTNLGTVEGLTAGQRFRPAPADARDTAEIRAELAAEHQRQEARRAERRDVDGTPVAPGDLVELIDQGGGGRAGRPSGITRVIRLCLMGIVVARPYARPYGEEFGAGEGLAIADGFRRLPDQTQTGATACRSCGCPVVVRDQILPPPADGWGAVIQHTDRMAAQDRSHNPDCRWADPTDNAVDVLYQLADDLDRAGEDVHAGKARRLAYYLHAGDTNLADMPDTLRRMPCPQHIRPRIEQAAAAIDPRPQAAPKLALAPNHQADASEEPPVHAPQRRDPWVMVRPGDTPPDVVMFAPATRAELDQARARYAPHPRPEPRMYGANHVPVNDMVWASPELPASGVFRSGWASLNIAAELLDVLEDM